jgi:drug/metabolite transporter (DMT)-like permease
MDVPATTALIAALLCWSAVPLMLRYLRDFVPDGWTSNAVRYPAAVLLYLPWILGALRDRSKRRLWLLALVPTVPNLLGQACWAWAPYFIDPGLMSFVVRLSTIWAMGAAILLFPDERPLLRSPRFWVGVVLSAAGFVAVSLGGPAIHARATIIGIAITLVCSVSWGMYIVGVRAALGSVNPLTAFAIVGTYTAAGCLVLAPLGETGQLVQMTIGPWTVLLLSALLGIAFAHSLYYLAAQRLGVTIVTAAAMLTPFVTAAVSTVLFSEGFTAVQWLGGTVLVIGTGLVIWSQEYLRLPQAPPDADVPVVERQA